MLEISKFITENGHSAEVNDNGYGSSISKMNQLAAIAKSDFPSLTDEDINIVQFGGISKKGIFGLQFRVPSNDPVPEDYLTISRLEKLI